MGYYREIRSENYIGYVLDKDVKMYSAAYHIIKKGQYSNFIKGYFLKQNDQDKICFNTSDVKPLIHMVDVMEKNALLELLGRAISFMHWVKHSSFVRLDSVVMDPMNVYLDAALRDVKFICLPISNDDRETSCIEAEKQFVYLISYILYYANCFEHRGCEILYADCQSGYYLLDDLYRDLCNGRYGDIRVSSFGDSTGTKEALQFCTLKCTDQYHHDIVVNKQTFIIGKKKEIVDYCINEEGVSRQHCKITISGSDVFLEDMNSTNGTLVNDVRIFPEQYIPLQHGDRVTIAAVTYEFQ